MIKLIDLLRENSQSKYEFGCVMLYFDFPHLFKLQDNINPDDIYEEEGDRTYGLEDEPHCTLLYGLHERVTVEDVEYCTVDSFKFNSQPYTAHNVSCFKNEKYDVLKFDVKGDILHEVNHMLTQELPYTTDFPKYHPHLTIAYLKPGLGEKYIKMFKELKYELKPEYIIFSHGDKKDKIKIN